VIQEVRAMTTELPTIFAFCGWHRVGPRFVWQLLANGATEREASERLHAKAKGGDFCVVRAGIDPNVRRRK
jgi:hypothetical protein